MIEAPSGTVTFVFTDVVGSTALWEADRSAMAEALRRHDALVSEVIDETCGYLFCTAGDSFGIADVDEVARESHDVAYATGVPSLIALHHMSLGIAATGARRDDEALSELHSAFEVASSASLTLLNLVRRQLLLVNALRGENHVAATHGVLAIEGLLATGAVYAAWVAVRFSTLALAGAGYADEALVLDAACAVSQTASRRLPVERRVWQAHMETIASSVNDAEASSRAGRALSEQEAFELALEILREMAQRTEA